MMFFQKMDKLKKTNIIENEIIDVIVNKKESPLKKHLVALSLNGL